MPAAPTPFADPLRLPSVIDIGPHHHEAELDIDLRPTRMRLHSELPDAEFWGYRGEVPGPTVNLRRGTRLRVRWRNCIPGTLPFPAVHVPTTDTHPMHVHLVQFQVMSKERYQTLDAGGTPIDPATTSPANPLAFLGPQAIPPNEVAWKDTVRVNPGEKTTIAARFDGFAGRYVYHCHVLEHEDHDMMRPFDVLPPQVDDVMMRDMPMTHAGGHGH